MFRVVNLGKLVSGEKLERILVEAAADVGLRAASVDQFKTEYTLGSVHKNLVYGGTEIRLRGRFLPVAQVLNVKRGSTDDKFYMTFGLPFSFSSEETIEKYLAAVSKRI